VVALVAIDDVDDDADEDKGAAAAAVVAVTAAAVVLVVVKAGALPLPVAEAAVEVAAGVVAKVVDGFLVLLSPSNSITPSSSSLSELQLPPLGLICTGLFVSRTLALSGGRFAFFSRNTDALDT
jgi:hypothetical protein